MICLLLLGRTNWMMGMSSCGWFERVCPIGCGVAGDAREWEGGGEGIRERVQGSRRRRGSDARQRFAHQQQSSQGPETHVRLAVEGRDDDAPERVEFQLVGALFQGGAEVLRLVAEVALICDEGETRRLVCHRGL